SDVRGSYVMTAAAKDRASLALEGERLTAFTGELVNVLRAGIPDGPDMLGLNALFEHVRAELVARRRPEPKNQDQNGVGNLPFVPNRALAGTLQPPARRLSTRQRALVAGSVGLAFVAGLLVPFDVHDVLPPRRAGGPCSPDATLVGFSDALNKTEVNNERVTG